MFLYLFFGVGGTRESDFFTKNPNLKKVFFGGGTEGGGEEGVE